MRSKANKCTLWLQGKPLHEQKRLVNFAISQAKDDRVRRCVLEKSVEGEIVKQRKEFAEERAMKNRSEVIRQVRKALKVRCASDLKCEDPLRKEWNISFITLNLLLELSSFTLQRMVQNFMERSFKLKRTRNCG